MFGAKVFHELANQFSITPHYKGLGFPNCWNYYRVTQLSYLPVLHNVKLPPMWVHLEKCYTFPYVASSYLWILKGMRNKICSECLNNSLKIWDVVASKHHSYTKYTPAGLILGNPRFLPGTSQGFTSVSFLLTPRGAYSLDALTENFSLPLHEYF